MKRKIIIILFFYLSINKLFAQQLPLYLPPDSLVTYIPLESDEITNSRDKTNKFGYFTPYKRNSQRFAFNDEDIQFNLSNFNFSNDFLRKTKSLDKYSNQRIGYLNELNIKGSKINYLKPITIGFWSSGGDTDQKQELSYILKDRLNIDVTVYDDDVWIKVRQIVDKRYQDDFLSLRKLRKAPLYSNSDYFHWDLLIIEFDIDKISVSINGSPLQTTNLTFLKKRDFKKTHSNNAKTYINTGYERDYGITKIRDSYNIDDVFIYEKLLSNEEISAIVHSELSPFYFKEIRDSIKSIKLAYFDISNSNDLSQLLGFMNKNLKLFNNYSKKFNELNAYPKVTPQRINSQSKFLLDSLRLTHTNLEKLIGDKVDYILDSLLSKLSKQSILNTYNTYFKSGKDNISISYLENYSDKFKKAIISFFYQSLDSNNTNIQAQQKLISDFKIDFIQVLGEDYNIDMILNNHPPKSRAIKFYSTSNQYIINPKYEYKDEISAYMKTIKWDQKELNFINYKLDGVQKFYEKGYLVYEYQFKNGSLSYEKWYDYSTSNTSPKIFDEFYDSKEYYERGMDNIKNKKYSNALLNFNKAIYLNDKISDYYYFRGSIYLVLHQNKDFKHNNLSLALIDLDKAIELNSSDPNYYDARGKAKYYLNDLYGCYQDLKQASEMGFVGDQNLLSKVITLIKENEKKAEDAERAIKIQEQKKEKALASKVYRINEAEVCDNLYSYKGRTVQIIGFYAASQKENQGWSIRSRNDYNEEQLNSSITFQFYDENEIFYTRVIFVGSCPIILRIPRDLQNVPNLITNNAYFQGVVIGRNTLRVTYISR